VPLSDGLLRVLTEFPSARRDSPREHPLGRFIRHDLAADIRGHVDPSYLV
jgi:hypothetical protein